MKKDQIAIGVAVLLAAVLLFREFTRSEPAALTPEQDIRELLKQTRKAQPPKSIGAVVENVDSAESYTVSTGKETYTVDPSIEYAEMTIKLRPSERLKGKILFTGK